MSEESVEIVRQLNAALNRGDFEGQLSYLAEDAEIRDLRSAPDQPLTVTGMEAIRGVWAEWNSAFDELRADVDEWIEAGDAVIAHAHWWGTGRESGASAGHIAASPAPIASYCWRNSCAATTPEPVALPAEVAPPTSQ